MAPQAQLFDNHQCRRGYRGRHAFRDLNLRSANKNHHYIYLFSLKCIVFKVFLFLFQAVLDVRNGPGPSVQFTENGGVSTFYLKTTRVFLFPNKELYWLWFPLQ